MYFIYSALVRNCKAQSNSTLPQSNYVRYLQMKYSHADDGLKIAGDPPCQEVNQFVIRLCSV